MPNFWEQTFKKEGALWQYEPADSAIWAANYFHEKGIDNVLIPGVGYGRNTKPFLDKGIKLSGIEISASAIKLAREKGLKFSIHEGSVLDMPFGNEVYGGIYCYAVLHLFNRNERKKIIHTCYQQLCERGIMIFVVVSKDSSLYGSGKEVSRDRFKLENGLSVFFYDEKSIGRAFKKYGLYEFEPFDEPIKFLPDGQVLNCWMIRCKREI